MIHYRSVIHILSTLLIFLAVVLIVPALIALHFNEGDFIAFVITIGCSLTVGLFVFLLTRGPLNLEIKDGYLVVTFSWLLYSLFGALPFYLSGFIPFYTDAFFETMSGFTTTGASILTNIEALPHGLLFWRSLTHWIGGMGIILLSLAILPLLGIGGMQLFKAEVPGPTPDRLTPRIKHTAELLWGVYLIISVIEAISLKLAGMNWFDAWCHTFGTMATGGFSTKNASVGAFNSAYIDYIIIFFMIIAGTNFSLHYRAIRGNLKVYLKDKETIVFLFIIITATVMITVDIISVLHLNIEYSFRHVLFQVVSILTTTGFGTADYEQWPILSKIVLLLLMYLGGCAGSTGGGMKIIRSIVLFKFAINQVKQLLHPNAIFVVRVGNRTIPNDIVTNIAGFTLLYIFLSIFGVLFMSGVGLDWETSIGSVAATINNIGPGLGSVGPTENYAHLPVLGKWFSSFLMLTGRLEVYTVLVLFVPLFWRK
ncbi:MAG: TrkH family potassium uptake protein [Calditrichaeota bacterium]|nr:TrkH family potassium uptake protein [Calditrichota bacterium]